LKYLELLVLPIGVNVLPQDLHLYLTKEDFEKPHLKDFPPQKGHPKERFF